MRRALHRNSIISVKLMSLTQEVTELHSMETGPSAHLINADQVDLGD